MINVTDNEKTAWLSGSYKILRLEFLSADGSFYSVVTNDSIKSESMSLTRTLCDEDDLTFGKVSSACFQVSVKDNGTNYKGMQLTPTLSVTGDDGTTYSRVLGIFTVDSSQRSDDKAYRDIVAYDSAYTFGNKDVVDWYDGLTFGDSFTIKDFRDSFFNEIGITQETVTLPNDSVVLSSKGFTASTVSGLDVIESICEINGCFGTIGTDGTFKYVFINDSTADLSLSEADYTQNGLSYEDYVCKKITKVDVKNESGSVGATAGTDGNTYTISNNMLVYSMDENNMQTSADNLLTTVSALFAYTPTSVKSRFAPWVELGDTVSVASGTTTITFPALKQEVEGITACWVTTSATGEEEYEEAVNAIDTELSNVNGKTNVLKQTLDETISALTNGEGWASTVGQTASKIYASIAKDGSVSAELSAEEDKIAITANRISIKSENFELTEDGILTAKSGTIGDFKLYKEDSITVKTEDVTVTKNIDGTYSWHQDEEEATTYESCFCSFEFIVNNDRAYEAAITLTLHMGDTTGWDTERWLKKDKVSLSFDATDGQKYGEESEYDVTYTWSKEITYGDFTYDSSSNTASYTFTIDISALSFTYGSTVYTPQYPLDGIVEIQIDPTEISLERDLDIIINTKGQKSYISYNSNGYKGREDDSDYAFYIGCDGLSYENDKHTLGFSRNGLYLDGVNVNKITNISSVGTMPTPASPSGDITLTSKNTGYKVCSIDLPAGSWILFAKLRFVSTAKTGTVFGNLYTSSGVNYEHAAAYYDGSVGHTILNWSYPVVVTKKTTYYLNAMASFDGAVVKGTSGSPDVTGIRAMRII